MSLSNIVGQKTNTITAWLIRILFLGVLPFVRWPDGFQCQSSKKQPHLGEGLDSDAERRASVRSDVRTMLSASQRLQASFRR